MAMQDFPYSENDFIGKITSIIEENISNEQFGVSELAREVGMSRSNLLRKIKKSKNVSASQFIREVRLKNAMEMLKKTSLTVSEVTYEVGFGSTSYFIKCFHDYFGYPPGEVGKRSSLSDNQSDIENPDQNYFTRLWQELKRRKVVKVIIVYASISFILLQLLSILIKPLFLPQWMMTTVIVLLAIGFPIAIIFSWIFDFTPTGLEVTKSVNENKIQQQATSSQKNGILYTVLIAVLMVVVVILIYPKIFKNESSANAIPKFEKSIAVLPFKNDSNDSTNVYMINGLMEAILNKLQKIEDLRVISRTSVEKYRYNRKSIPESTD
jgi:AraC-like DNA-binding protein